MECRDVVRDVLLFGHGRRFVLHIATVMPDHAHAILEPHEFAPRQWVDLAEITKAIKGASARRINQVLDTVGKPVWRRETFDRIIRDQKEYDEKVHYVANNPVKAGICADPFEYEYLIIPDCRGG
jgi:REP element-mobilizing transposase RayT